LVGAAGSVRNTARMMKSWATPQIATAIQNRAVNRVGDSME
jgi:hypothetical protein